MKEIDLKSINTMNLSYKDGKFTDKIWMDSEKLFIAEEAFLGLITEEESLHIKDREDGNYMVIRCGSNRYLVQL